MEEARLTTRTLAEAEVEDVSSKAKEDSNEEDSTTKAKALTTMEDVDSKAEDSKIKDVGLEEAKAASTQMISTSNNHLVLLMTAAPLQPTKQDSSPTGTAVTTHRIHTRARIKTLMTTTQTRDGADNQQRTGKSSHQIKVSRLNSCWSSADTISQHQLMMRTKEVLR